MTVLNDVLLAMEGRDSLAEVSTFPPCTHTHTHTSTASEGGGEGGDSDQTALLRPVTWSMTLMASLMLIFW